MTAAGQTIVQEPRIRVNGQVRTDLRLLSCERWAGGQKLDAAVFEVVFDRRTRANDVFRRLFTNQQLREAFRQRLEFEVDVEIGPGVRQVIHWGTLAAVQPQLSGQGPVYELVSQLKPIHFGYQNYGYPLHRGQARDRTNYLDSFPPQPPVIFGKGDPAIGPLIPNLEVMPPDENKPPLALTERDLPSHKIIQHGWVFNPYADGQTIGNLYPQAVDGRLLFLDPDQTRGAGEIQAHGLPYGYKDQEHQRINAELNVGTRRHGKLWSLATAVYFACNWLNPPLNSNGEKSMIANWSDSPADIILLEKQLSPNFTQSPTLRDVHIPLGAYLPQILDTLLHPYGFDWFVDLVGPGERKINFFRRGTSTFSFPAFHQQPGEVLDHQRTNLERFSLRYDVAKRCVNQTLVLGGTRLYEATFQLIPAWTTRETEPRYRSLVKNSKDWATDPELYLYHRQWVLNEGGSCIGKTVKFAAARGAEIKPFRIASAFDLEGFLGTFNEFTVRNRRFLPCITRNPDRSAIGTDNGVYVEYSTNAGKTWRPIADSGEDVRVLQDECGIRFDGDDPPAELLSAHRRGLARVRVTATIMSDNRVSAGISGVPSISPEPRTEVLDVGEKFHYRYVHPRSRFYLGIRGGVLKSSEVDETFRAMALTAEALEAWNQADCDGRLVLPTIQIGNEQLGLTVKEIRRLGLGLTTNMDGSLAPSIVGIIYDYQQQETTLVLNSYSGKINLG